MLLEEVSDSKDRNNLYEMSTTDTTTYKGKDTYSIKLHEVITDIATKIFHHMSTLDGKISKKTKPIVSGVGTRYWNYLKEKKA